MSFRIQSKPIFREAMVPHKLLFQRKRLNGFARLSAKNFRQKLS
jgi:hypothetical protein